MKIRFPFSGRILTIAFSFTLATTSLPLEANCG